MATIPHSTALDSTLRFHTKLCISNVFYWLAAELSFRGDDTNLRDNIKQPKEKNCFQKFSKYLSKYLPKGILLSAAMISSKEMGSRASLGGKTPTKFSFGLVCFCEQTSSNGCGRSQDLRL